MSKSYSGFIEFESLQQAERFWRGYVAKRVVVKIGRRYRICTPGTARRKGWKVLRGKIIAPQNVRVAA